MGTDELRRKQISGSELRDHGLEWTHNQRMPEPGAGQASKVVLSAVVALSVVGFFLFAGLRGIATRRAEEQASIKESSREMTESMEKVLEGGKFQEQKLPDTPTGRMMQISQDMVVRLLKLQEDLDADLAVLGWGSLGEPETITTKEQVEGSLESVKKAGMRFAQFSADRRRIIRDCIARLEKESHSGPAARDFFAGIQNGMKRQQGMMTVIGETDRSVQELVNSLTAWLHFLRPRVGHYRVLAAGEVQFDKTISRRDLTRYDELVIELADRAQALEELEERRLRVAREEIEKQKARLR